MAKKKKIDYHKALRKLEDKVVAEVEKHLRRIGKDFIQPSDEEAELEFFGFENVIEQGIKIIKKDGFVVFDDKTTISIYKMVNEAHLPLIDIICLLDELRVIKKGK